MKRTMEDLLKDEIFRALGVLKRGGIILYPTDTLWGIGCDATNAAAVEKIYALKKSIDKKSMLILLDHPDQVLRYVQKVPEVAWQLIEVTDKPLTLILPGARGVAENLVPEEQTIGIRLVDQDFCKKLIYKLNRPLVSTSANVSGEVAPVRFADIPDKIKNGVDYIVDPAMEGHPTRRASAIIRLGLGSEIEIIRE